MYVSLDEPPVASSPQKNDPDVVAFTSQLAALRFSTASDVEVAFVVVEFKAVKFWSVVDPDINKFESEVRPPVAVKVVPTAREPVKLAVDEMVCPLIAPEVMAPELMVPAVKTPMLPLVEKRLVEEAVV